MKPYTIHEKHRRSCMFALCLMMLLTRVAMTVAEEPVARASDPRQHGHSETEANCRAIAIPLQQPQPITLSVGGQLTISPTFDATVTAARQAVLEEAIAEWEAIIQYTATTPDPYPISFSFVAYAPGDSALAVTSTSYYVDTGNLAGATMTFNTNYTWYVDPNPATDDEFEDGSPPANFDLLTVARHEIGHAVGYADLPRVQALLDGSDFDPPRLNIAWTTTGGGHTSSAWLPNDLMVPSIGTSTRRPISIYPDASLVARAYEYHIPADFVDPTYLGTSFGDADSPWRDLTVLNIGFITDGYPIVLSNDTHQVPAGWENSDGSAHVIIAARGGSIVLAP